MQEMCHCGFDVCSGKCLPLCHAFR